MYVIRVYVYVCLVIGVYVSVSRKGYAVWFALDCSTPPRTISLIQLIQNQAALATASQEEEAEEELTEREMLALGLEMDGGEEEEIIADDDEEEEDEVGGVFHLS